MPQYAGMPEDTSNSRVDACGCKLVRVAQPGNPWIYLRKCANHEAGRDDLARGEVWPDDHDRQWYMDDEFEVPMPEWLAAECKQFYGTSQVGIDFAQGLASFLDAKNLVIWPNRD